MKNAAPFVREAVVSILQEKSIPLELIVIDDGSDDGSADLVRSFKDDRVKLIDGPVKGIAACLNAGLSVVRGDVVMRCDADDIYPAGRMRWQTQALSENPGALAVCGALQMIDAKGRELANISPDCRTHLIDISEELQVGVLRTPLPTFGIRRSAIDKLSGFREYFATAEDLDFAFRLGTLGPVLFSSLPSYRYRIHDSSITHSSKNNVRNFFDIRAVEFALQRRRSGLDDLMLGCAPSPPRPEGENNSAGRHAVGLLVGHVWRLHSRGQYLHSIRTAISAVIKYPISGVTWILLAKVLVKSAFAVGFKARIG